MTPGSAFLHPWFAVIGLTSIAMVGCTSTATLVPTPDPPTQAVMDASNERQWDRLVRPEWSLDAPVVEEVMPVDSNRRTIVLSNCMVDAGFDALTQVGDSVALATTEVDAKAAAVAYYTCSLKYPELDRVVGYLSVPRRTELYTHLTQKVLPCLRLLGYAVDAPPSRDIFVSHYYREEGWNPYSAIALEADSPVWRLIDARCAPPPRELGLFHP